MVKLKLPEASYLRNIHPLGACYTSRNPLERWVYRARLKACLKWIEPTDKCILLDIGSGGGVLFKSLDELDQVVGLDIEGIAEGKKTVEHERIENAHLALADACYLPFKDNVFDYVLCVSVLDHIKNVKDALNGIARVLKPTGKLIVGIVNESPLLPLFVIYAKLIKKWKDPFGGHCYSPTEIQAFLSERYKIVGVGKVPSFFTRRLSVYVAILCEPNVSQTPEIK